MVIDIGEAIECSSNLAETSYEIIWLVVWNIFIFQYIGNVIIPTDFHIFQRGRPTTNQLSNLIEPDDHCDVHGTWGCITASEYSFFFASISYFWYMQSWHLVMDNSPLMSLMILP
jgi:hypothetical protein